MMWTHYDEDINNAKADKDACERALAELSSARDKTGELATHAFAIQAGVDQCFNASAGASAQVYVDPILEKIGVAIDIVQAKINSLENYIKRLEYRRFSYIRVVEEAAFRERVAGGDLHGN